MQIFNNILNFPESPFKVEIKDDIDPTKIRFDDLERIVAKKGHESKFDIDTRLAGQSDLKVLAFDPHGRTTFRNFNEYEFCDFY